MHIMNLVTGLKLRARINVKAFLSEKFWSKGAQNKKSLRHHEERAEQSQGKPSSSNQGVSKAAPLLGVNIPTDLCALYRALCKRINNRCIVDSFDGRRLLFIARWAGRHSQQQDAGPGPGGPTLTGPRLRHVGQVRLTGIGSD